MPFATGVLARLGDLARMAQLLHGLCFDPIELDATGLFLVQTSPDDEDGSTAPTSSPGRLAVITATSSCPTSSSIRTARSRPSVPSRRPRARGPDAWQLASDRMGFSRTLELDDYFRAMVYGSDELLDGNDIARLFVDAGATVKVFEEELEQRVNALEAKMTEIFDAIDAGRLIESQRLVDGTLEDIAACIRARDLA